MSGKQHVVADMEINTFLRAFDTRTEAIEYVRRLLKTNGDAYVADLAIGRQTNDGHFVEVVTGDELLALVRTADARNLVTTAGNS